MYKVKGNTWSNETIIIIRGAALSVGKTFFARRAQNTIVTPRVLQNPA